MTSEPSRADRATALIGRARIAAGAVLGLGVAVLALWLIRLPPPDAPFDHILAMKANTAIGLALAGAALLALLAGRVRLGRGLAIAVLAVGGLTLAEWLTGTGLGIDELVALDHTAPAGDPAAGRMSVGSAILFVVAGLALLGLDARPVRGIAVSDPLAVAVAGVAFMSLLGRAYDEPELFWRAGQSQMSIQTAIGFLALAFGLLTARPDRGLAVTYVRDRPGGRLVRALTPVAIVIPAVVGGLVLLGQRADLYGTELGLSAVIGASIVAFLWVGHLTARSLDREDGARRFAEAALEDQRRLTQAILDSTPAIVHVKDRAGRYRLVNAAFERGHGLAPGTAIGRTDEEVFGPGRSAGADDVDRVFATGLPVETERTSTVGGEERVWASLRFPLTDRSGAVSAVGTISTDVTERRRLEDQLEVAQRLESTGRLAGTVAHDFNNILTAIRGFAQLASEAVAEPEARDDIEQIQLATERASDLTRQLLAFSRRQVLAPTRASLNDVVDELRPMLDQLLGGRVALRTQLSPALGAVEVDRVQIEQVIINLAINARDAMTDGGTLTIETSEAALDADYAAAHPGATPGEHVMIAVTDTGVGMDAETLRQVFEPFFTTKGTAGSGLGLATVYGIVRQSGGHVWAYSEPGRGTTIRIYLPRAGPGGGADEPAVTAALKPAVRGGRERILVLEDDPGIREASRRALTGAGYDVLAAGTGEEGVDLAAGSATGLPLVCADLALPDMSGREAVERIRATHPAIRVLFTSGYPQARDAAAEPNGPIVDFLQKPYTADDLAARVRDLLDRPA